MKKFSYLSGLEIFASLVLLIYPALMLLVKGGMNAALLVMLLVALLVTIKRPSGMARLAWQPEWNGYVVAMLSMTVAIFISQIAQQNLSAPPHDAVSRYWLAIPVFILFQRLNVSVFKTLQWAFPIAAGLGFLLAKDSGVGLTLDNMDKIHFGDFELLFGVLSLLSIHWFRKDSHWQVLLKILGGLIGIFAAFESGTRGGWLTIPALIVFYVYLREAKVSARRLLGSIASALVIFILAYTTMSTVQTRVDELKNDVLDYQQGSRDSSTGIRWQLYGAAADIFLRHPWAGVGPEGFAREMQPMQAAGKITANAAELGKGEVHNDLLAKAAGMGILGIIALLSIYVAPLRLFLRAAKSSSAIVQKTGVLGAMFVSGIFVFGWTVEFLNLTLVTAFYAFTVAVLLALCYNAHHATHETPALDKDS